MVNKSLFRSNLTTLLLVLSNFLFIFNYKIFVGLVIFLTIMIQREIIQLKKSQGYLLKLIPVSFYSFNLLSIFLANPRTSSIFWDMQDFLHFINCNSNPDITYIYKFISDERACVMSIGYGPISNLVSASFDIWQMTLIIFSLFALISIYISFNVKENIHLFTVFLISPSFNFLVNSLNADIFVFLFFIYLFNKKGENLSLLDLICLSFLIQLKVYPIGILLGYLFYYLKNEDMENDGKIKIIFFTSVNFISLFYFFIFQESTVPGPLSYTRTFGVYHDYLLVTNIIGYKEVVLIISFLSIVGLILYLFKPSSLKQFSLLNLEGDLLIKKYFIFFPTAFMINIFQNFGYKFIFNFFLIYIIYISSTKINKSFLTILILSQTTYYLIGYGYENNYLNNLFLISSKLLFYMFFIISIYYYFLSLKKINNNYNF